MIDYILTVTVSISAGTAALTSKDSITAKVYGRALRDFYFLVDAGKSGGWNQAGCL